MKKDGTGGANTNRTGLPFERSTKLVDSLVAAGFTIQERNVLRGRNTVAQLVGKSSIHQFLAEKGTVHAMPRVGRLEPDDAIYVMETDTLFVIEKKWQEVEGSTDEKIQTAVYKMYYYNYLLEGSGIKLRFIYLLNDWFKREKYELVIKWLRENGVDIHFNSLPLSELDLE